MANPISVPGSVVPSGSLISPGGAQGVQGLQGPTVVSADTGNQATLGSDSKIFVPDPSPTIWSARLRSFSAVGNPTFEVDQRTVGTGPPGVNTFALDRWFYAKAGTMTFSVLAQQDASASPILLPGTNFALSQNFFRFTLGTQQAVLGASDKVALYQFVEGPRLRELISDVHSLQVLARSSVAGLSFGVSLQDVAGTRTLVKLATIPSANTWTLIPLANLPVWAAGTTWSVKPGVQGYFLGICLAAGSTITAAANNTWQNANVVGALGQSNFAAQTVGSTFDLAFVQHEPGAQCTTPMDCPFTQNYDDCLRYYAKLAPYASLPTAGYLQRVGDATLGSTGIWSNVVFPKRMAKNPPTIFTYGTTGVGGQVYLMANGANAAVANSSGIDAGITNINLSANAPATGANTVLAGWSADTGW